MTDLADVRAELLPSARPAGTASLAGRPISWVRVMKARVPAFDALEPGDLLIVPASLLALMAPTGEERAALAAALAAAPVSGVVLLTAEADDSANDAGLAEFGGHLGAAGIGALQVGRTDPVALERSVIGFIVARGAELERQAGLLESELQRRALEGGGPQALVAAIATFLGRPVALESSAGRPLAIHAPPAAPEGAAIATRYAARPRHVAALRFPLPTTAGPAGSLVLLGEDPVGELGRATIERIGGLLALELARDEAVRAAADSARRADALPGAGPPWVVLLARQRASGPADDGPLGRAAREAARHEIRLLAPARQMALRGDADSLELRVVLAVPAASESPTDDPERNPLAGRIASLLDRPVALSRPFSNRAERPAAEGEARQTLDAALALAEPPQVARASRLPVYRLLSVLHNLQDGPRLARALLEPILGSRPDVRREHVATLRAVLDRGGVNEAAAALGVHRNTVAYRLRRIETLTGWRLADPDLRLALSVAVRLVQDD